MPPTPQQQLDPYKVLNLPKQYDVTMLKKAYLKQAMKTHPDRGGTPQLFQQVSIAYTLLTKKLKEKDNDKSHHDLQSGSRSFIQSQDSQPKQNINMKDKFDSDLFNKIYDDNKIKDMSDEGYGSWMDSNSVSDSNQPKLFQNGFNKDMFNATFEQYKKDHSSSQQLTKYKEPQERLSMKNQDSLVVLGQKKVSDFSGSSESLQFTDYKQAFTDGSTLIDVQSVSLQDRARSIDGVKQQRSNLSYQLSPEDQQRVAIQQMKRQQQEDQRIQRLQVYDQQHKQSYDKIHQLLLR